LIKLGCVISFFRENIAPTKFGRVWKIRTIEKNTVFDSASSISFLVSSRNDIFRRKEKYAPRFGSSCRNKNFSSKK
jgi:hypothetical protein